MQKARPLAPGDTIAVIAPASAPRKPEHLKAGIAHLERLGYRVEPGRPDYPPTGFLAGSDQERLHELNSALRRPDIHAVFCVRGGYGSMRLLPDIDYDAVRVHPKLLVGYSDITALHLALFARTGLPGVAGAMVASDFCDPEASSLKQFWKVLAGDTPMDLTGPDGEPLTPIRTGIHEGTLLGGNLTLMARLMNTPFLPSLDGAILFFEEIGEEPYRLDGLLAQLRLSGILDRAGGVVVGAITEWEPKHERPSQTLDEVLGHYLRDLSCPVASGLMFGHMRTKIAVPVGVRARLEVGTSHARLTVLEPVVSG